MIARRHLLIFVSLISLIIGFLIIVRPALAVDVINCQNIDPGTATDVCKEATKKTGTELFGPNGILTIVVRIISLIVGVAAVIVIILAGLRFMLSGGDPQKVSTARNTVIYAVVGVVIAAMAQFIVAFVLSKL